MLRTETENTGPRAHESQRARKKQAHGTKRFNVSVKCYACEDVQVTNVITSLDTVTKRGQTYRLRYKCHGGCQLVGKVGNMLFEDMQSCPDVLCGTTVQDFWISIHDIAELPEGWVTIVDFD